MILYSARRHFDIRSNKYLGFYAVIVFMTEVIIPSHHKCVKQKNPR